MPLSYSRLQTYRRCPKQYEYAVIKKIGRPISRGESFGSSIHNALKRWGELEVAVSGGQPSTKSQLTLFTEAPAKLPALDQTTLLTFIRECFIAEGYPSKPVMDQALREAEACGKQFFEWWKSEKRTVVGCECGFSVTIDGPKPVTVSGRLDRVEKTERGLRIIDYKTSKPRPQSETDADLQLSIYALAAATLYNEPLRELILLHISGEHVTEVRTTRSPKELEAAKQIIRDLSLQIDSEDFTATPSHEKCRSCPYRNICPARAA